MGLGQWAKAAADYAHIVELEPQNAEARHQLAICHVQLGRYQEAIDGYRELVERLPKAIAAAQRSGLAFGHLSRREIPRPRPGGRAWPRRPSSWRRSREAHWNTLGVAHYRAGDWKAAVVALEKSMELRTGRRRLRLVLPGHGPLATRQKDEARKWYDKAVAWMEKNQPKTTRSFAASGQKPRSCWNSRRRRINHRDAEDTEKAKERFGTLIFANQH